MISNEEIVCNVCGNKNSENYYKDEYSNTILCEECLLEIDGITSSTETTYYLDGEYIGSNDNYDELIENILANTTFEQIGEEEQ